MDVNVIIKDSLWLDSDVPLIFLDEEVVFVDAEDMQTLMVEIGAYPSKSAAMRANRVGDIPDGFTPFKASKKMWCFIWNPRKED